MTLVDFMLHIFIGIIGLAEATHLLGVVLGQSFSACELIFFISSAIYIIICFVFLCLCKNKKRKYDRGCGSTGEISSPSMYLYIFFGIIVLIQLINILQLQPFYIKGDLTVESINSILSTGKIGEVNPLTGGAYLNGVPLRLKLLCLPTFYAYMCELSGMDAVTMVYRVAPAIILLLAYLIYYSIAGILFGKDKDRHLRPAFMLAVAGLLVFGTYAYGMDGFMLLYAGGRALTIRNLLLVPYTISSALRKKWFAVIMCILCEACITWTFYGLGVCIVVAALITLISWLRGGFERYRTVGNPPGKDGAADD